jgi:hypothetical protein
MDLRHFSQQDIYNEWFFFCFSVGTILILYKFVMMPQRVLRANQFLMPCLIPPLLNEISSLK